MKSIPPLYSQAKDVFPVTRFASQLQVTTLGTNDEEVVALDLQFEDNEVLDIIACQVYVEVDVDVVESAENEARICVALFEDPDKALATDTLSEAVFEDDSSLIYTFDELFKLFFGTVAAVDMQWNSRNDYFMFPQPYTVARNVKWILRATGVDADIDAVNARATIWGRRRNAADAEFKNIIYRQRF